MREERSPVTKSLQSLLFTYVGECKSLRQEFVLSLFFSPIRNLKLILPRVFSSARAGRNVTLQVEPSDTIDKVKQKLQYGEGIHLHQQRLFFGDAKHLEGARSLAAYGIQSNAVLHLVIHIQIFVKCPSRYMSFVLG